MEKLSKDQFEISEHSDTLLKGSVTISENNDLLFTSIPYDEGWKVYIDGEEKELVKTANSLLAVEISEGTHTLKFKYLPDHFILGNIVAVSGLLIFVAVIITDQIIKCKRKKRKAEFEQDIAECFSNLSALIDSSKEENNDTQTETIDKSEKSDTTNNTN